MPSIHKSDTLTTLRLNLIVQELLIKSSSHQDTTWRYYCLFGTCLATFFTLFSELISTECHSLTLITNSIITTNKLIFIINFVDFHFLFVGLYFFFVFVFWYRSQFKTNWRLLNVNAPQSHSLPLSFSLLFNGIWM